MVRIYLDVCCFNRPLDDQEQARVRLETEAVEEVLLGIEDGRFEYVGSEVVLFEVGKSRDIERKLKLQALIPGKGIHVELSDEIQTRARAFEAKGVGALDALHVAAAEKGEADVFLTTDDQLLRKAPGLDLRMRIVNPLKWISEVTL